MTRGPLLVGAAHHPTTRSGGVVAICAHHTDRVSRPADGTGAYATRRLPGESGREWNTGCTDRHGSRIMEPGEGTGTPAQYRPGETAFGSRGSRMPNEFEITFDQYHLHLDRVSGSMQIHSNVCLAQPFESNYRCPTRENISRGAAVTTTADSAALTAHDRPQDRVRPMEAMNDETPKPARALPGRPPGIRADSSGLTDRQRRVIEVIRDSVQRRGYPPSMREIGQAVGLSSTSSVAHQLMALERKGFLRRDPHRPRAYEVRASDSTQAQPTDTAGKPSASYVPLVGRIAAGGRSSPRSPSRTCSRSPASWWATVSCSF